MMIRDAQLADLPAIRQLFRNTICNVNCRDYTPEQIAVWSGVAADDAFWQTKLHTRSTYVAETHGQIVGFAMLGLNGYIDCFYCHHRYQQRGVGSKLLHHLETIARTSGIQRLFSEVSITAKPFFQHKGYGVVTEQIVERHGVSFCNFLMEKYLEC
jgi:putative acetyltransferase